MLENQDAISLCLEQIVQLYLLLGQHVLLNDEYAQIFLLHVMAEGNNPEDGNDYDHRVRNIAANIGFRGQPECLIGPELNLEVGAHNINRPV